MAGLTSDTGYHGQAHALVHGGQAIFGPFRDNGAGLLSGDYELSISLSVARLQSAAVRKYLGETGELMSGPLIVHDAIESGSWVSFKSTLTVS